MKVSRRQASLVIESEGFLQLSLAALAYAQQRIVLDNPESFPPHLDPVSCAPLFRIKQRYAARMLYSDQRQGEHYQYAGRCRYEHSAAAACQCHNRDADGQAGKRRSSGSQNQGRQKQWNSNAQEPNCYRLLLRDGNQKRNRQGRDKLQNFGIGFVMTIEARYPKIPPG